MSVPCEYRKLGYGFDLPPGYVECEYIESTGTQWLDFEWYANGGMLCKLKGIWSTGYKQGLVMSHDASNNAGPGYNRNYIIGYGSGSSTMEFGLAGNMRTFSVPNYNNGTDVIEVEFNTRPGVAYAKVNGTVYSSFNTSTVLAPLSTVQAFYEYYNHVPNKNGRLYYCTIIDVNDVVVRDLVPCLDFNGVPGMFDKVTGKTFYNQGTGTFNYKTKPTPFPYGYTELEYLESTSSTYIDTGVTPSVIDMRFECKVQCSSGYNYGGICALWDNRSGSNRYYLCYVSNSSGYGWLCSKGTLPGANAYYNEDVGISSPIEYVGHIKGSLCEMTIDGVAFTGEAADVTLTSTKLPLFTSITNGGLENVAGTRLWYAKIYDEGELVRDFLPYLDPYGVPCMVDILTGKPYYNAGTGTFNYKLK